MTSRSARLYHAITLLLATGILLAACAPTAQATLSPEEIVQTVSAGVAMTLTAQAEMAPRPSPVPSATPEPTATPTTPPPSDTPTPFPTITPFVIGGGSSSGGGTSGGSGGSGGGGYSSPTYSCDPDIGKKPRDNTVLRPGDPFDVKFTIVNTGTATWEAGKDLRLVSDPYGMIIGFPPSIELPRMEPGDSFTVGPYDAVAPGKAGTYIAEFKLEGGFCWPYVAIKVENP